MGAVLYNYVNMLRKAFKLPLSKTIKNVFRIRRAFRFRNEMPCDRQVLVRFQNYTGLRQRKGESDVSAVCDFIFRRGHGPRLYRFC